MHEPEICSELGHRLIFNDPNVRRLEKKPVPTGDTFRLWCGCNQKTVTDAVLTPIAEAFPEICCKAYRYSIGWVWVGKCPDCDMIVFFTERGER